jgi:hypothetical protein
MNFLKKKNQVLPRFQWMNQIQKDSLLSYVIWNQTWTISYVNISQVQQPN